MLYPMTDVPYDGGMNFIMKKLRMFKIFHAWLCRVPGASSEIRLDWDGGMEQKAEESGFSKIGSFDGLFTGSGSTYGTQTQLTDMNKSCNYSQIYKHESIPVYRKGL